MEIGKVTQRVITGKKQIEKREIKRKKQREGKELIERERKRGRYTHSRNVENKQGESERLGKKHRE